MNIKHKKIIAAAFGIGFLIGKIMPDEFYFCVLGFIFVLIIILHIR